MKIIQLTQGKVALIDDDDCERVVIKSWYAHRTLDGHWYAKSDSGQTYLHRFIMRVSGDLEVDHIDGDGLNNQKSNLRVATSSQNKGNMRKREGLSSQYKGVTWDKSRGKWIVHIHNPNQKYLGRFNDEREAALAYDVAAREYFGEFALTNFAEGGELKP